MDRACHRLRGATVYDGAFDLVLHRTEDWPYDDNLRPTGVDVRLWVALRRPGAEPPCAFFFGRFFFGEVTAADPGRGRALHVKVLGQTDLAREHGPMPEACAAIMGEASWSNTTWSSVFTRERDSADPEVWRTADGVFY